MEWIALIAMFNADGTVNEVTTRMLNDAETFGSYEACMESFQVTLGPGGSPYAEFITRMGGLYGCLPAHSLKG